MYLKSKLEIKRIKLLMNLDVVIRTPDDNWEAIA